MNREAGRRVADVMRTARELILVGGLVVSCAAPGREVRYFEPGSLAPEFDEAGEADAMNRRWYSAVLQAMEEPALIDVDARHAVRFLWLRSFDSPLAVRLEVSGGVTIITSAILEGDMTVGEDEALQLGSLIEKRSSEVTSLDWGDVLQRLEDCGFWSAPRLSEDEMFTWDGATWVLEVVDADRYRVVQRHTPDAEGPYAAFREFCLELVVLAGIEVPPADIH